MVQYRLTHMEILADDSNRNGSGGRNTGSSSTGVGSDSSGQASAAYWCAYADPPRMPVLAPLRLGACVEILRVALTHSYTSAPSMPLSHTVSSCPSSEGGVACCVGGIDGNGCGSEGGRQARVLEPVLEESVSVGVGGTERRIGRICAVNLDGTYEVACTSMLQV